MPDTFQENFGIQYQFAKYLMEHCGFDFEQYSSFKYILCSDYKDTTTIECFFGPTVVNGLTY